MAQNQINSGTNIARIKSSAAISISTGDELKLGGSVFHDFLGEGSVPDSSPAVGTFAGKVRQPSESSPSASVSVGASSGGGRGPISSTSDLGSDRPAGGPFEGVPCYGPRSDFIGPEKPNVLVGMKRSYSNSFAATSAERFPSDSVERSIKLLRNTGGDRPRRPCDEDSSFPLHLLQPASESLMSQPSSSFRNDANASRWDSFVPINPGLMRQYPTRASEVAPFGRQSLSNKLIDSNAGHLVALPSAADEGSRTGIKGYGTLNSLKEVGRTSERNCSGVLASSSKQNSYVHISEPEPSLSPCHQHGLTSAGRQMTIFYNGQAHVFDSVHPNKADIIMALAGSNGESWSTIYAPKSSARKSTFENCTSGRKNDIHVAGNLSMQPAGQTKSFMRMNSSRGFSTREKMDIPTGAAHEDIREKEAKTSTCPADTVADKKP